MSINSYLDCTTGHIAPGEAWIVQKGEDDIRLDFMPGVIVLHHHGAWLWVDTDQSLDNEQKNWFDDNAPSFLPVLKYARENGCNWINFDADGDTIDGIPTYEW